MAQNTNNFNITEFSQEQAVSSFCECWEMVLVKSGTVCAVSEERVYNLKCGEAVFFAPNSFHNIIADDSSQYVLLSFNGDGEVLDLLKQKAVYVSDDQSILVKSAIALIDNNYNTLELNQAFKMLELFLLLCCERENIDTSNQKNAKLFSLAAEILQENIKLNISVNELAERLDISLSNLKRVFISLAGVGAHEYYTFLKIAKAKELLKQGKSVTETAELTGFANQAYFSAAFKRVTGKSPKEYMLGKQNKGNNTVKAKKDSKKKADMPSYLL